MKISKAVSFIKPTKCRSQYAMLYIAQNKLQALWDELTILCEYANFLDKNYYNTLNSIFVTLIRNNIIKTINDGETIVILKPWKIIS